MNLPSLDNLTIEQYDAVMIPLDESCIVTGPPGSGKTVIAILRLRQAHANGKKTKLITHKNVLKDFTSYFALTGNAPEGITSNTTTFDAWFKPAYKRIFNEYPPTLSNNRKDWWNYTWEKIVETALASKDIVNLNEGADVDVIIDEGQDLPKEFYYFANLLGATTTVFADEHQRLTETNSSLREIKTNSQIDRMVELTINFRNTRAIAEFAESVADKCDPNHERLYISDLPSEKQGKGEKPTLFTCTDTDDVLDRLLNYAANNAGQTVGILTSTLKKQEDIYRSLLKKQQTMNLVNVPIQQYSSDRVLENRKSVRKYPVPEWDKPGIYLIQYASSKGLEFDLVYLPGLDQLTGNLANPEEPLTGMTFYTLITRARQEVWLSYSGTDAPKIMDLFDKSKMEVL